MMNNSHTCRGIVIEYLHTINTSSCKSPNSLLKGSLLERRYIRPIIRESVDSLYVGMAPTRPLAVYKQNNSKLPNAAVLSCFRHISVSTNGYIPDRTLKVCKIHCYSDIWEFAKKAILHLLLLLLQLDRHTTKLVHVLTFIFGQND